MNADFIGTPIALNAISIYLSIYLSVSVCIYLTLTQQYGNLVTNCIEATADLYSNEGKTQRLSTERVKISYKKTKQNKQ